MVEVSPLQHRELLRVDRRFNRARYGAEQTVAAFAAQLKEAVGLDSVCKDLTSVVTPRDMPPWHQQ